MGVPGQRGEGDVERGDGGHDCRKRQAGDRENGAVIDRRGCGAPPRIPGPSAAPVLMLTFGLPTVPLLAVPLFAVPLFGRASVCRASVCRASVCRASVLMRAERSDGSSSASLGRLGRLGRLAWVRALRSRMAGRRGRCRAERQPRAQARTGRPAAAAPRQAANRMRPESGWTAVTAGGSRGSPPLRAGRTAAPPAGWLSL